LTRPFTAFPEKLGKTLKGRTHRDARLTGEAGLWQNALLKQIRRILIIPNLTRLAGEAGCEVGGLGYGNIEIFALA